MATPFIGEIKLFGGNFQPRGFAFCDGRLLPISEYSALFALIGTTYGGNGQTTFALPDLRGRIPINQGAGPGLSTYVIGQSFGSESVTLNPNQMPAHNHIALCNSTPGAASPANGFWAATTGVTGYGTPANATMNPQSLTVAGGSQPHENRMPLLALNYIIALEGIFPSRN